MIDNPGFLHQKVIAQKVRDYRTAQRLSQRALASRMGIPKGQIHEIENPRYVMKLSLALCLANTMKCSLDWLVGREEFINIGAD